MIFGWSGSWDSLPASHAASIAFDVITLGALYLLGRRLKGNALGIMLAYAWAAYPFTLFTLSSNTNDGLVSAPEPGFTTYRRVSRSTGLDRPGCCV